MTTALLLSLVLGAPALADAPGRLSIEATEFRVATASGETFGSSDLIGAVLEAADETGQRRTIRIDAVTADAARPQVKLHAFSVQDPASGRWSPLCQPDAKGRQAGFPIRGHWDRQGRYVRDPDTWFLTCTSGAQGKCLLFGYDPWSRGPGGQDLTRHYEACTRMVRADYAGDSVAHTRDGTVIDVWDDAGVQTSDTGGDASFSFEAGWGPAGAVCVARTRYSDLQPREALIAAHPALDGPCDEGEARRRGAVVFNRSR
jgi:hypothetical protein